MAASTGGGRVILRFRSHAASVVICGHQQVLTWTIDLDQGHSRVAVVDELRNADTTCHHDSCVGL